MGPYKNAIKLGYSTNIFDHNSKTKLYKFMKDSNVLTFSESMDLFQNNFEFRQFFIQTLNNCPFEAFYLETPGANRNTIKTQIFECAITNSESLAAKPFPD